MTFFKSYEKLCRNREVKEHYDLDLENSRLWLAEFYVPSKLTKTEFCLIINYLRILVP